MLQEIQSFQTALQLFTAISRELGRDSNLNPRRLPPATMPPETPRLVVTRVITILKNRSEFTFGYYKALPELPNFSSYAGSPIEASS